MTPKDSIEPSPASDRDGRLSLITRILVYATLLILLGLLIYNLGYDVGTTIGSDLNK